MRRKYIAMSGAALTAALILAPTFATGQGMSSQSPAATPQTSQGPDQATQPNASPASSSSAMSGPGSSVSLSAVSNPEQTLASATVQDSSGQQIGQVQKVKTGSGGKPTAIEVSLTSSNGAAKTVAITASKLRYDQSSNKLTTDLTAMQVQALPSVNNP